MEETHPDSGTGLRGGRTGQALERRAVTCILGLTRAAREVTRGTAAKQPREAVSGDC